MKRIAVGQIQQETNTLNPILAKRENFEAYGLARGDEIMAHHGDVSELGGFAALPQTLGQDVEWLGLIRAKGHAGGPLSDALLEEFIEAACEPLRRVPVDGVLLALHGALASTGCPDAEGSILKRVRETVGPEVPVVATLDLHANITRQMVDAADVLVGYHTFPHIDAMQTGRRAARVLADLLLKGPGIRVSATKIPMVVNTRGFTTDKGVMADIYRRLVEAECEDGVISTGLYMAQPWLDVPDLGWTLYQAFRSEKPPLQVEPLVRECWQARKHNQAVLSTPTEVVQEALSTKGGPVVISEGHDATNSGAPGDSTRLLAALISRPIPEGGALTFCVDKEAVERCHQAGSGRPVKLMVGGRRDPFSEPVELEGTVSSLGAVRFLLSGHGGHNLPVDLGRAGVVKNAFATIVLTEREGNGSSPKLYQSVGIDPKKYKIVVAKSPEGFRHDYEPMAAAILYCGAPGCASANLKELPFHLASRPLFPLDDFDDLDKAAWTWTVTKQ